MSPDLLRKKNKGIDISCDVLGTRCSAVSIHPCAVQAREHPHRPTPEQPLHQHLWGVGSVWTARSYPNCREEAGGSLSETLWQLCLTWKTYSGWFYCFTNHSLQLPWGTGKIKTRQREVPGLWRPFQQTGRSHEIHVHINTGRRRPGPDGWLPWPIISQFTKICSFTRPAGVDPGLFQRQKQQLKKHGQESIRRAADGSRVHGQMPAALGAGTEAPV